MTRTSQVVFFGSLARDFAGVLFCSAGRMSNDNQVGPDSQCFPIVLSSPKASCADAEDRGWPLFGTPLRWRFRLGLSGRVEMTMEAYQVNAFATDSNGGSPTGVVLHADGLTAHRMLEIARALGMSHTAFLSKPTEPGSKVAIRFFTPRLELKNCAHATIAAHLLLAEIQGAPSHPVIQETMVGAQRVWIRMAEDGMRAFFRQNEVVFRAVEPPVVARLLSALGTAKDALDNRFPVAIGSPGSFRFLVPMRSAEAVLNLAPRFDELNQICVESETIGCFAFSVEPDLATSNGRMFAPPIGVNEDAVNGNSSGCLGAYLLTFPTGGPATSPLEIRVQQGTVLQQPATVYVEARRVGDSLETLVGGNACIVGRREEV